MISTITTKLGDNGRLVIPSEIRKQLKLKDGDPIRIGIEDGKIVILTSQGLLNEFYNLTQNTRTGTEDAVQDLIDERRREATSE